MTNKPVKKIRLTPLYTLRFGIICLLFFATYYSNAQDQWLNFTNNNTITDIIETTQGNWLASTGGLCFYEFSTDKATYYNRGNSDIPSNSVLDLHMGADGVLWMTTSHGICKYENGQFTSNRNLRSGILNETIDNKIILANAQNLYIQQSDMQFDTIPYPYYVAGLGGLEVNQSTGAIYFNGINFFGESYVAEWLDGDWKFLFLDFIYETSITLDHNDRLWLLTSNGLSYLSDTTWMPIPDTIIHLSLSPSKLHVNKDNEIVIQLNGNCPILKKWDGQNLTDLNFVKDECKDCLFIKPSEFDSELYFSTNVQNGLYTFTPNNINDYQPLNQSPLIYNSIRNTLHRSDGSHLIIYHDNIQVFKAGEWNEMNLPLALSNQIVGGKLGINDILWIYNDESLWYFEDNQWNEVQITIPLANRIDLMDVGPNGEVWIQSGHSIARYMNNAWDNFQTAEHDISTTIIKDLEVDPSNGDLWVSSFDGVRHFNGQNWIRYDFQPSNFAQNLTIGNDGVYVISNGKIQYINNGLIDTIAFPDQGIYYYTLLNTYQDVGGEKLFLAGSDAVTIYDGSDWTTYTTQSSGHYNGYSNDISIDQRNNIWLSGSAGGLSIFNPDGVTLSSVEEPNNKSTIPIHVYPTLVEDNFIFIRSEQEGNYQISISDLMGRLHFNYSSFLIENEPLQLNLPPKFQGSLIVNIGNKTTSVSKRIVKLN